MRSRWLKRAAQAAITLLLLAIVLSRVNLARAAAVLLQARPAPLAAAILLVFPIVLVLWAARWHRVLRLFGIVVPFPRAFLYSLIGNFAGLFLSDTLGGFTRAFYLREDGFSAARAFLSVFMDKAWELAMLLSFGLAGLLAFPTLLSQSWLALALPLGAMAAGLLVLKVLGPRGVAWWTRRLQPRFTSPAARWAGANAADLVQVIECVPWRGWAGVLLVSALVRLTHFTYSYLLAVSLGIPISFPAAVAVMSIVGVVSSLPISIGGLGAREATMLAAFGFLNLPGDQAIAFSFLIFLVGIVWRSVGLVGWLRRPLSLSALRLRAESDHEDTKAHTL